MIRTTYFATQNSSLVSAWITQYLPHKLQVQDQLHWRFLYPFQYRYYFLCQGGTSFPKSFSTPGLETVGIHATFMLHSRNSSLNTSMKPMGTFIASQFKNQCKISPGFDVVAHCTKFKRQVFAKLLLFWLYDSASKTYLNLSHMFIETTTDRLCASGSLDVLQKKIYYVSYVFKFVIGTNKVPSFFIPSFLFRVLGSFLWYTICNQFLEI